MFRPSEPPSGSAAISINPNAESAALLRQFADERSQSAFAAFVQRHIDLVYSAALRRCAGDAHRAEDIAQLVFTAAARDAKALSRHPTICAWLHTATRNVAVNLYVSEHRRIERERTALMNLPDPSETAASDWHDVRVVLDRALDELAESDRAAVLLRFFEKKSYAEIGAALNLTENSARMRTDRALEKLRLRLAARGIRSTAAALGGTLASRAVTSAPTYLAAVIAGVVMRQVIGTNALTLPARFGRRFVRPAVVVGSLLFVIGGGTFLATRHRPVSSEPIAEAPTTPARPASTQPELGPSSASATDTETGPYAATIAPSALSAPTARGTQLTAETVLKRMADAYAALSSYQDSGDVTPLGKNLGDGIQVRFRTAYSRPDKFRVDCFNQVIRSPHSLPTQSVVILQNGKQALYYSGRGSNSTYLYSPTAMGLSIGSTKGATYHVPRMILASSFTEKNFAVDQIAEPKLLDEESIENIPCYVVSGRHPNGTAYSVWVAKADFFIRKITTIGFISASTGSNSAGSNRTLATTLEEIHRDIRVNEDIPNTTFDVPSSNGTQP